MVHVGLNFGSMTSLLAQDIFIIVYYFPPTSSSFSLHKYVDKDDFQDLYFDIVKYSALGEVILLWDFNAWTRDGQIPLHNRMEDALCLHEIVPTSVDLQMMH
jgi:hypothetical protein